MDSFEGALDRAAQADLDLVIIDTPPAIEAFDGAIRLLVRRVDLCLVPSNQGGVDPSVATSWLKFLKRERARAACILNRAKSNSRSFKPTKIALQSAGQLCPFEVRDLEDIKETVTLGLGVLELAKAAGVEDYRGVWAFVRSELGFQDTEA
jgi:chromosome partitioning protein